MPKNNFVYMFRSPNNTPTDGWESADMAMQVLWDAKYLVNSLEKQGWWEGSASDYNSWWEVKGQPRLAGDIDNDGDVDADDEKLAEKLNTQAREDEAFVDKAVAEGTLAKPGSRKRAPKAEVTEETEA